MTEIVYDTFRSFEEQYGLALTHIKFHRDGFGRENLALIESFLFRVGLGLTTWKLKKRQSTHGDS